MSIAEQGLFGVAETPDEVREQLHEYGYANIGISLGNSETQELFADFKDFVALTEERGGEILKNLLAYKARPDSQLLGNESYFLDLRLPGEHNPHESTSRAAGNDHKYIFHFGPQTVARALDRVRGASLPAEMTSLLDKCSTFYYEGRAAAKLGARALRLDGIMFDRDPTQEVHHLRLIDYIASENGEHAEAHFDRGVTTLAINESHPGLRGLAADNGHLKKLDAETRARLEAGLLPVSHQENVSKFFASAGLRRLPELVRAPRQLDSVPLFAHDVVNEKPGVNRQAAVMFFNPTLRFPGYTVPSKEETSVRY